MKDFETKEQIMLDFYGSPFMNFWNWNCMAYGCMGYSSVPLDVKEFMKQKSMHSLNDDNNKMKK